jgi:hypothetical protein
MAIANGFWTLERDAALKHHEAAGLSASKIAVLLGTSRSAVLGRSSRLRGKVFKSQVDRSKLDKIASAKRRGAKAAREDAIIAALRADLHAGVDRIIAIGRARRAGATLRAIARFLGLTHQRVHQIAA